MGQCCFREILGFSGARPKPLALESGNPAFWGGYVPLIEFSLLGEVMCPWIFLGGYVPLMQLPTRTVNPLKVNPRHPAPKTRHWALINPEPRTLNLEP